MSDRRMEGPDAHCDVGSGEGAHTFPVVASVPSEVNLGTFELPQDIQTVRRLHAENDLRRQEHLEACKLVDKLTAERDTLREQLETQTSRAEMWKARCNHGTDASELQPGEEAYERLRAERDQLKAELNRERASLSAACEASDRRAADLNREVIADNERLRSTLKSWEAHYGVGELRASYDEVKAELSTVMKERRDALQRAWNAEKDVERLREAVAAVTSESPDGFSGAQYDVSDTIAYVDNEALKALRALLAKLPIVVSEPLNLTAEQLADGRGVELFELVTLKASDVAELVKAARALDTMIAYGEVYNDDSEVIAFRAALKPFEGK